MRNDDTNANQSVVESLRIERFLGGALELSSSLSGNGGVNPGFLFPKAGGVRSGVGLFIDDVVGALPPAVLR